LIGGQACIFYGAAEFSRDADIAILASHKNMQRLANALKELKARCIAVPDFSLKYLKRGHAIHFRCYRQDIKGIRIDVMSVMRGGDTFRKLWQRRTTINIHGDEKYELISLPDLVRIKKTQRDKDWPMIRRLVEAHYFQYNKNPAPEQIDFWFRELRTPSILINLAGKYPSYLNRLKRQRPLLEMCIIKDIKGLEEAIEDEEKRERESDKIYWSTLVKELEQMRHDRLKHKLTRTRRRGCKK
jgi:hypothetical protein